MKFNLLGQESPFYILREGGEKPILDIGKVKEKILKNQLNANPGIFNGINVPQQFNFIVEVNGKEEQFPDVPADIEIANYKSDGRTFTGTREAMLQAVDNMLQKSKKRIEEMPYHNAVVEESEKFFELLNPKYKKEKEQAKAIDDLKKRQAKTDKTLESIADQNKTIMDMLKELTKK